jgi:hypothetical protein
MYYWTEDKHRMKWYFICPEDNVLATIWEDTFSEEFIVDDIEGDMLGHFNYLSSAKEFVENYFGVN